MIQIGQEGNNDFPMMVLANKVDREDDRQVTKKEVADWAEAQGLPWKETSAKECTQNLRVLCWFSSLFLFPMAAVCVRVSHLVSAINVDKAFLEIARLVLSKTKEEDIKYVHTHLWFWLFTLFLGTTR